MTQPLKSSVLNVRTDFSDNLGRVCDLSLAELLGYQRPRDIRHLVRQLFLGRLIETTPDNYRRGPGRPGRFYWLTYEQARRVIGRAGCTDVRGPTAALEAAFIGKHAPMVADTGSEAPLTQSTSVTPAIPTLSEIAGDELREWRAQSLELAGRQCELLARIVELLSEPAH